MASGLVAAFAALGKELDGTGAAFTAAGVYADQLADKQKKLAEATDAENKALANQKDAIDKAKEAMKEATEAAQGLAEAQKALSVATASGTDSIDLYGDAATAAQKKMSGWTPIWFSVTAATDAQNTALENLLKTQGAYDASIAHTLDTAKGWKDYLAGLADAYQTGAMDLLQYKNALVAFQTQLVQTFSGATGEARKAIEDMTRLIQKLIDTAGGGPQTPTGAWQDPTQQLNNIFNK